MASSRQIAAAHHTIAAALEGARAPRVLVSFGKDSCALVDLLAEHGVRDALTIASPDEAYDAEHVARITERYNLRVEVLPEGRALFQVLAGTPLVIALVPLSSAVVLPVPLALDPYRDGEDFACLDELLRARAAPVPPRPLDLVFSGQKATDAHAKACASAAPLLAGQAAEHYAALWERAGEYADLGRGVAWCQPLLHWADADVWSYIEARGIPWSRSMYDAERRPRGHLHRTCTRCHDPGEAPVVDCPRAGGPILNLAALAPAGDLALEHLRRLGVVPERAVREVA